MAVPPSSAISGKCALGFGGRVPSGVIHGMRLVTQFPNSETAWRASPKSRRRRASKGALPPP